MSISIRKTLGYALTDVTQGDPRINWASPLIDLDAEPLDYAAFGGFVRRNMLGEWLSEDMVATAINSPGATLDRCIIHDREADDQPVLLVISPKHFSEWYRRDGLIDYVEAHLDGDEDGPDLEPVVTEVPAGIYPYAGDYMDSRSGLQLAAGRTTSFRRLAGDGRAPDVLGAAARAIRTMEGDRGVVFNNATEAKTFTAPIVPDDIKALVKFGELFTDPGVWKQLRPVHYKWWA